MSATANCNSTGSSSLGADAGGKSIAALSAAVTIVGIGIRLYRVDAVIMNCGYIRSSYKCHAHQCRHDSSS
nr:hypothetical protein [uncultured Dialister sp.]